MTDKLAKIAENDTPESVTVPATWAGILTWAAGRWGVGILVSAVFIYWANVLYTDSRTDRAAMVELVQAQTEAMRDFSSQTATTNKILEKMDDRLERLEHN